MQGALHPLDALDRRILYWMDCNCRMSIRSLARKLRVSPSRLHYRLDQLIRDGVIKSFVAVIDYRRLGYRSHGVHYKLRELGLDEVEHLMRKIARDPRVLDMFLCEGTFNAHIAFLAKELEEAEEIIWDMRDQLSKYIIDEKRTIRLKAYLYHRNELLPHHGEEPEREVLTLEKVPKPAQIDEDDQRLLAAMAVHANWPVWKIAKAAGMRGPKAYARIKRLEEAGVIRGYQIVLNPDTPGFAYFRVVVKLHYIPPERRDELMKFLQSLPSIDRCTFTYGDYDLSYDLLVENTSDLRGVMNQVYDKFRNEVITQDWVRVSRIIKFSYFQTAMPKKS